MPKRLQGIVGDGGGPSIVGDLAPPPPFPIGPRPDNSNEVTVTSDPPFPAGPEPDSNSATTNTEQKRVTSTNPGRPGGESGERGAVPKLPNALNSFASYSVIQTLSVLTKQELADPDNTYRINGPRFTILRSGGVGDQSVRTAYEQELGITTEYFIEDLEVDAIMMPTPNTKQTNATLFRFKVIEPYSMGMFFETIANAVQQTEDGRSSYIEAPFLLTIEFIGYTDKGKQQRDKTFKRHFPLKIDNIEFSVNAGGSIYDVTAYAWNDQAFADEVQTVNQDVKLIGENVAELLQIGEENQESLTYILNTTQLKQKEEETKQAADAYVIMFPEQDDSDSAPYKNAIEDPAGATSVPPQIGATVKAVQENGVDLEAIKTWAQDAANRNEIGRSKLTVDTFKSDNPEFNVREADQTTDGLFVRLDGTTYNPNKNALNFSKGRRIQDIIEDVIIMSEYGRQLVDAQPDSTGRKKWFRIESETYDVVDDANETQQGRSAKIYVYRVVPYLVHQSTFAGAKQVSPGIPILKNRTPKEYEYIYSGQNDSIIDFEIQFNSAFYQAIQFDLASAGQDSVTNGQDAGGVNTLQYYNTPSSNPGRPGGASGERGQNVESAVPSRQVGRPSDSNASTYSGGQESPATKIARAYNQAIVNGVDLIQAEMEIIGDPYFISDSGIGNYRARPGRNQTTSDGTIDYQYSEPYIILNFKTPIDLNSESGRMDFPSIAGEPVRRFSGLYKITELTNVISANKFTQRLKMIRLRYQEQEETEENQVEAVQQSSEAPFSSELQQILGFDLGLDIPPSGEELESQIPSESIGNVTGEFSEAGSGISNTPLDNETNSNQPLSVDGEGTRRITITGDTSDFDNLPPEEQARINELIRQSEE